MKRWLLSLLLKFGLALSVLSTILPAAAGDCSQTRFCEGPKSFRWRHPQGALQGECQIIYDVLTIYIYIVKSMCYFINYA
jgi:hypothetical protein